MRICNYFSTIRYPQRALCLEFNLMPWTGIREHSQYVRIPPWMTFVDL